MSSALEKSRSYQATPPFFLHGSTRTEVHRANLCVDFLAASAAAAPERLGLAGAPGQASRRQLLLWIPAKLDEKSVSLLQRNIRHARETAGADCCDLFPAFGVPRGQEEGAPELELEKRALESDRLGLLRQSYRDFGSLWESRYEFVWLLGRDLDISLEDIHQVLQAVRNSSALIAQPEISTFVNLTGNCSEPATCSFRANGTLTMTAPLISTYALKSVLDKLLRANASGEPLDCSEPLEPAPAAELAGSEGGALAERAQGQCVVLSAQVKRLARPKRRRRRR